MFKVMEFGTDFKSDYNFVDGDLELCSDKNNLIQAIINRLNTHEGEYDLFYNAYGGLLSSFLGWKQDESTLEFIKLEIINILSQDGRLTEFSVDLEYDNDGKVNIKLDLNYDDDSDLSLSFVIGETGLIESEE